MTDHPEHYCRACGHLWRQHQAVGAPSNTTPEDAPVPCFAARQVGHEEDPETGRERWTYELCGCRYLLEHPDAAMPDPIPINEPA